MAKKVADMATEDPRRNSGNLRKPRCAASTTLAGRVNVDAHATLIRIETIRNASPERADIPVEANGHIVPIDADHARVAREHPELGSLAESKVVHFHPVKGGE